MLRPPLRWFGLVALCMVLHGCVGEHAERALGNNASEPVMDQGTSSASNPGDTTVPPPAATNTTTTTATPPPPPPTLACTPEDFWPVSSPLRRLTNREYVQTLYAAFYTNAEHPKVHESMEIKPWEPGHDMLLHEVPEHFWTSDSFINKAQFQGASSLHVERYEAFATWLVNGRGGRSLLDDSTMHGRGNDEYPGWSPCKPKEDADLAAKQACGAQIAGTIAPKLMRRPLEAGELAEHEGFIKTSIERYGFKQGVGLYLTTMLQSPEVLYRPEFGLEERVHEGQAAPLDPYELASRLSFFLWGGPPDATLLRAAEDGSISTPEGLESHARRMLVDPKAKKAIMDFFEGWLKLDKLDQLSGSISPWHVSKELRDFVHQSDGKADAYRTWTMLRPSLKRSVLRTIEWAFWEAPTSDGWGALIAGDQIFSNALMSELYGLPNVPKKENPEGRSEGDKYADAWTGRMERVTVPSDTRSGLLTHPGVLAMTSHGKHHSPIFRGVHLMSSLLCQDVQFPGDVPSSMKPGSKPCTTREHVALSHSWGPACQTCHGMIDNLGFAFEHYDVIGAWRKTEDDCGDVDASVTITSVPPFETDIAGDYDDARGLAQALKQSQQAKACMATHWLRYALGRQELGPLIPSEREKLGEAWSKHRDRQLECQSYQVQQLVQTLDASGGDLQELVVALILSPSFRLKAIAPGPQEGGAP